MGIVLLVRPGSAGQVGCEEGRRASTLRRWSARPLRLRLSTDAATRHVFRSVLKLFAAGKTEEAQAMAVALARANSMARRGAWVASGEAHPAAGGGSLVETFRGHTAH